MLNQAENGSGKLQGCFGMGCSQALACHCDDNDIDDGKAARSHTHLY